MKQIQRPFTFRDVIALAVGGAVLFSTGGVIKALVSAIGVRWGMNLAGWPEDQLISLPGKRAPGALNPLQQEGSADGQTA